MSVKRIAVSFSLVIVMGLTQWLIEVGIHTPGQQQPSLSKVVKDNYRNGPSAPLGGCN